MSKIMTREKFKQFLGEHGIRTAKSIRAIARVYHGALCEMQDRVKETENSNFSKREEFAKAAMQGILSNPTLDLNRAGNELAKRAFQEADSMIERSLSDG